MKHLTIHHFKNETWTSKIDYIYKTKLRSTYLDLIGPGGGCGRKYFNVTINTTYNIANTPSILKILKYTQHKYIVQV
jgi:hypothetical protein